MNREEVMIILDSYREAKRRLFVALMNFEEEMEMLTQIQIDYSKIKVQNSAEYDKIGNRIEQLNKLRKIYTAEADVAIDTMEKVKGIIAKLEDQTQREILTRRYIKCQRWEKIAEEMNYSRAQVFRLRDKAVDAIIERRKK